MYPPRNNLESWEWMLEFIDSLPDNPYSVLWKPFAREFIEMGVSNNLNQYFRAGTLVNEFLFSTLDHHGLYDEPRVKVQLLADDKKIMLSYICPKKYKFRPDLEYVLTPEEGFPTFLRFLNQLWTDTMPEPIPDELRAPSAPFTAPIL